MLDPSSLDALALRVESGSDRELDADIFQRLGGADWERALIRVSESCGCPEAQAIEYARSRYSPPLTTSLDAVKALIEAKLPGWAYAAISEKLRGCIGYVHNNEPSFVGVAAHPNPAKIWIECRASSPERALLAAALRALAQKEEG